MSSKRHIRTLHSGFLRNVRERPDNDALSVEGVVYTYQELFDHAASISATLMKLDPGEGPLTAIFSRRTSTTYAGILAILMRGHGYVPLNPKHPVERSRSILGRCGATAVIVDHVSEKQLGDLISDSDLERAWILPHRDDVSELKERWPNQRILGGGDLLPAGDWSSPECEPSDLAYVFFTSGSTGEPKGVMLEHRNVTSFVDSMCEAMGYDENDRHSQNPEISFDASVQDLWPMWEVGGTLCVPSDTDMLRPHEFIVREKITCFAFVPPMASMMHKLNLLKPNGFPLLKTSSFGGEVFPQAVAEAWSRAAPNGFLDNLYGPTELAVACIRYRWTEESPSECLEGALPIGYPMPNMTARVLDEDLQEVAPGESGQLWMSGPQVARGYWEDPERTAESFRIPPGLTERHYATGDRVIRPKGREPMYFIGRMDDQIQIRGHRVEPSEVEGVLRELTKSNLVVVLGWPEVASGSADGLVAFIQAGSIDTAQVIARTGELLPTYMCPKKLIVMQTIPTNANDKVDRRRLVEILKEEDA